MAILAQIDTGVIEAAGSVPLETSLPAIVTIVAVALVFVFLYQRQINQRTNALFDQQQQTIDTLRQDLEAERKRYDRLAQAFEDHKRTMDERLADLDTLTESLTDENERLQQELTKRGEVIQALELEKAQLERERDGLADENKTLTMKLDGLRHPRK